MRQIKFRAWIPPVTDGEITLPGYMAYDLVRQKLIAIRTETRQPPANFGFEHIQTGLYEINKDLAEYGDRLMQFTGLLDKNGKEIYEGDIVKDKNGEMVEVIFGHGGEGEPADYVGGYYGWCFGRGDTTGGGGGWGNEWEIIGNIYKNPELLK